MVPQLRVFSPADNEGCEHATDGNQSKNKSFTVLAVIERYLEHAESTSKFSKESLAERKRLLGSFAVHLGRRTIDQCCADDLAKWIDGNKRWRKSNTKRHKCQQVQACFNWAKKVGRIERNPFAGISYEEGEPKPAVPDDFLREILRLSDPGFRRFLIFLRLTGCRPCEAREILWEEVDWVREAIIKIKHKSKKKTKKPRVIPLTAQPLALLRWMRKRCAGTGPIFLNQLGRPWTRQAVVQKWDRLREKAGISGFSSGGLRHRFGSQAVRSGGNIKLISLAMGHASVATTERYYVQCDTDLEAIKKEMAKAKMNGNG